MAKQIMEIIFLVIITGGITRGQYSDAGFDYQAIMLNNPGLAGAEGDGMLRVSFINHYPGQGYNLFSGRMSFDTYLPSLHGGVGVFISNDYLGGIINDLQGGFSYAYYFRAGENLFVSAGLSASLCHRAYNFSASVLPEQIDPNGNIVYRGNETLSQEGRNALDLGTGFLFMTERIFWGISVNHLTEPDIDYSGDQAGKTARKLLVHAGGDLDINREKEYKLRPLAKVEITKAYFSAGAGAVLEGKNLSVSTILIGDRERNTDLQAGFALNTSGVRLYYNYRFNIASGKDLLPFSLLHHVGIVLGLNNVDKRRVIKTINYPAL